MKNDKSPLILTITAAALVTASANAAIVFTDPSFEDGGGTDSTEMAGPDYGQKAQSVLSDASTGVWYTKQWNTGREGGILETTTGYKGAGAAPTGATGNQFVTSSRGGTAVRGLYQYVQDSSATTGALNFSIDYWAHELDSADTPDGTVQFNFEVFAFNTPGEVTVDVTDGGLGTSLDNVSHSGTGGFVTTGQNYQTVSAASAATGFQTYQVTLDLGATGYDYVGVAISTIGDNYDGASGETISFDNLSFSPVPEPSAALLGGLGLLALLRRRR